MQFMHSTRSHRRGVATVAAAVAGGLVVVLASTTAAVATTGDVAAPAEGIEYVMSSEDTLGDVIERAAQEYGNDVIAADLQATAQIAEQGQDTGVPGLADADPAQAANVLGDFATSLEAGAELPETADIPLAEVEAAPEEPVITAFGAINDKRSWRDTYFLQVKVSQGLGWKITDRIDGTVTVDPGAASSRIGYKVTYFPSAKKFSNISIYTRAEDRNQAYRGQTEATFTIAGGSKTHTITNTALMRGKQLRHGSELRATLGGKRYTDYRATGWATCNKNDNVCKY